MSRNDEHRLRFRDAMANLSAAVNVITTDGPHGRCGITATAVCSVTDSPPTLLLCINRNSEMNPIFKANGTLCINVLSHEQEQIARHFAGMTEATMEQRFEWDIWRPGKLQQPLLHDALVSLEGTISDIQQVGSHDLFLVTIDHIELSDEGHGLIYFKRHFHRVPDNAEEMIS
ncbi:MAG: 4-hydroxyphenylacetate 3-monooxygenase, reductase component [Enterobacteriaceae bacterium]